MQKILGKRQIIESGILPPQDIMDIDAKLLEEIAGYDCPLLHFYEWEGPSLTYGFFIDPDKYLDRQALQHHGIRTGRRPTGGGTIFHLTDFAFSLLIPACHPAFAFNVLENYGFVNKLVSQAISSLGYLAYSIELLSESPPCVKAICNSFCMSRPTRYDLMVQGKKVGGAAQRKTKFGLLHQGSISLARPPRDILQDVIKDRDVVMEAMERNTYPLLGDHWPQEELMKARSAIKQALIRVT